MLTYKSKLLTLTAPKTAGKNKGTVDGFYTDSDGLEYFVKKPTDTKELFTELFAGLLLQEFMASDLIDEHYHASLICADVIQFENGSYGLIQPRIAFTELYKIIGTASRDGSDRDPLWEMLRGPQYYQALTKQGKYFGLSSAIMFSLLLGDYSVHSGNVVCLSINDSVTQFARIDWGAAFRYFAHKNNNTDILKPHEYDGRFNVKAFTKGYVHNYKNINGLFPTIAEKAHNFSEKITADTLQQMVTRALRKIPVDMLSKETRAQLADYMSIEPFKNACCANNEGDALFALEFTKVLMTRLDKLKELKEIAPNKSDLYQSTVERVILKAELAFDTHTSFDNVITNWCKNISDNAYLRDIDTSAIDISALTRQFNGYLDELSMKTETANLWNYDGTRTQNILASLYQGDDKAQSGYAFIAQYRESTILQRLFRIDPQTNITSRFVPYESPAQACTVSYWPNIVAVLTAGSAVINLLVQINKIKILNEPDATIAPLLTSLKRQLIIFQQYHAELTRDFLTISTKATNHSFDSNFFYPVNNDALNNMNAAQLATLCLEELDSPTPGTLIARIIKEQPLRESMLSALVSGRFDMRSDNPATKIKKLSEWCAQFTNFSAHLTRYKAEKIFFNKKTLLVAVDSSYEKLPACLQHEFQDVNKTIKSALMLLQKKPSLIERYQDMSKRIAETAVLPDKIRNFDAADIIFKAIKNKQPDINQDSHIRLEKNNRAYHAIEVQKIHTGAHIIDEPKADLINWLASVDLVTQETFDIIINHETSLHCLKTKISPEDNCRDLLKAAFSDKILWTALDKTNNRQLSSLLIQDLLTLKQFTDNKLAENRENQFGDDYSASIEGFYQNALDIRLSSKALPDQANQIVHCARNYFNHRHLPYRLLGDALLCISLLGLSVLIARKIMGNTFFFSSNPTGREQSFTKDYLSSMHVSKENGDELTSQTPELGR